MTEAILTHGTFKVCFNKKHSIWRWKRRQLSQNSSGLFRPKKIGWNNITLEYIYIEITQAYYFHIFYHRCGEYLKFCKYFGWTFFSNIGKYSFSFEFRVNFRKFISLTLNFIIKWQRLKICFKAAWKYAILPKRWVYFSIFELLSNITEHYFIFEHFSFYK